MRNSSALTLVGMLAIATSHTTAALAAEPLGLSFDLGLSSPEQSSTITTASPKVWSPLDPTAKRAESQQSASQNTIQSDQSSPQTLKLSTQGVAEVPNQWWYLGSESPLAVAIGTAEGTRTPSGDKTPAYFWHEDPGNGSDNFGTFSYQHLQPGEKQVVTKESTTAAKQSAAAKEKLPELADERQLEKLKTFHDQIRQQATSKGITLSELELLNALDLANQSESAALTEFGYIDRLAQMKALIPNDPDEQILEARTWSYWSPDRHSWDAPGLGNTYEDIRQDQERRMRAVQEALEQYSDNPQNSKQVSPIAEKPDDTYHQSRSKTADLNFEIIEQQAFKQLASQHLAQKTSTPKPMAIAPSSNPELSQPTRDRLIERAQQPFHLHESSYWQKTQTHKTIAQNPLTNHAVDAIIFYEAGENFL